MHPCIHSSIHLYIHPPAHPSIHLYIHQSIQPSINPNHPFFYSTEFPSSCRFYQLGMEITFVLPQQKHEVWKWFKEKNDLKIETGKSLRKIFDSSFFIYLCIIIIIIIRRNILLYFFTKPRIILFIRGEKNYMAMMDDNCNDNDAVGCCSFKGVVFFLLWIFAFVES